MERLPRAREILPGDRLPVIVVGDPGGPDIPEDIRSAWLGTEFQGEPMVVRTREIISRKPHEFQPVWAVESIEAIDQLRLNGQDEAADWWQQCGYYEEGRVFLFAVNSCQPLTGERIVYPSLN